RTVAEALILRRAYLLALPRDGLIVRVGAGEAVLDSDLTLLRPVLSRWREERSLRISECLESLDDGERRLLHDRLALALVIPLRWRGETVGGLLLGEKITRTEFTSEDVSLLTTLAAQMSVSLQNALLVRDRVEVARLEEELRLARQIQRSFLVSEFPETSRYEVHALNIPSKEVGGD